MARTIDEIQAQIIASFQADATLSGASSTSVTAIWRLITRVVAMAIATLENLFDLYQLDVAAQIELMKPHSARWYQSKALNYHHGFDLIEGDDEYDLTGFNDAIVEGAKIIAQAAAVDDDGILTIKVNKEQNGDLVALDTAQYDGFVAYIRDIRDAGVNMQILSFAADKMTIEIDVYYDPLILDANGQRLDGTAVEPVKDAIKAFLRALPFDGEFVKAHLTDALQSVDGVFVPQIRSCQITRFDSDTFTEVDITYNPYAGFIRIYNDADYTINYIANV